MKKVMAVLLIALVSAAALAAEQKASQGAFLDKFGLVFTMQNLLLDIDNYSDGYQAGAGAKYWLGNNVALRSLLMLHHRSDADANVNETWLGLSAVGEYHFADRKLSPYVGPLAGVRFRFDGGNFVDFYFGLAAGGEMQIFKNISAYAEYNLIASLDDQGFGLNLGNGSNASLGIIMYFK